ncbi:MAG: XisI protein [Calothrix sp. MO_167.B12]|nr:XisI protein [Calothrix sp. MO_167.B12]
MAKVNKYRQYVQELLTKYASYKPTYGDIEVETIFDTERNHYQIVHIGWENKQRVYGCSMHIDIKDEKIWIQWNATEIDIANELVEMGVAKQDIVIGFHSPYLRKFTDFAVG